MDKPFNNENNGMILRNCVKLRFELTKHRKSICDVAERIPGTIAEMVLSQLGLGFGWDLDINENGDCETSAFTFEMNKNAAGVAIGINTFSKEDFNWIFRECGAVDGEVKAMKDDFFHDNVYLFDAFSEEETKKLFDYIYSNHSQFKCSWFDSDYDYDALVEALKEAGGAGVRLICYSKDGETLAGKAFMRMHGRIPLRARSLFRMLTPGITIAEVPETVDSLQDAIASDSISWESFCGCMDDMLRIYLNAAFAQRKREKDARNARMKASGERWDYSFDDDSDEEELYDELAEDDSDEEEEDDDELYDELADDMDDLSDLLNKDDSMDKSSEDGQIEAEGSANKPVRFRAGYRADTDIDECGFSVRTFNCLRRAGINKLGQLADCSYEKLSHIRNMSRKCLIEIDDLLKKAELPAGDDGSADISNIEKLQRLIGLKDVKEQVQKITAYARMKQDFEKRGIPSEAMALNMEFTGNPGTAKTTVARILAGLFYEIGLTESEELVEVGRSDLVAEYVGQTAIKVKGVFDRAKGKVLFIDEAYSLTDDVMNSYGDEAITEIVKEMGDVTNGTIVIFAGYPKEMDEFFKRNPGLRSRVPFKIAFPDYSPKEMEQIAELEAGKRSFTISDAAKTEICEIAGGVIGDVSIGNGRFSRNLVQSAILQYAARVYGCGKTEKTATEAADEKVNGKEPAEEKPTEGKTDKAADTEEASSQEFVLLPEDFSDYQVEVEKPKRIAMGFRL